MDSFVLEEELVHCVKLIKDNNFKRITLQFPDELLEFSTELYFDLTQRCHKEISKEIHFYVLGDTSFNSCCVDTIAAQHIDSDFLIHFGPACLEKYVNPTQYLV
jgi:diphthamide biosynthesis protein 2